MEDEGRPLPRFVREEFEAYLRCGRLSLTPNGNIRHELKTPYRDGTTHVILEPMDFMARLAALVPRPRVNLIRYHGVFAPASSLREQITPARRGKGGVPRPGPAEGEAASASRRSMTWAQRLRRVFDHAIQTCEACGGPVKVMASIQAPGGGKEDPRPSGCAYTTAAAGAGAARCLRPIRDDRRHSEQYRICCP